MEEAPSLAIFILCGCSVMLILVLALIFAVSRSHKRLLLKEIEKQKIQKEIHRQLFKATIDAEERQKNEIYRNLHDTVIPHFLVMQSVVSEIRNSVRKEITIEDKLKHLEELTNDTATEIRSACYNLVPVTLQKLGLIKAIEQLIFSAKKQLNCKTSFNFKSNVDINIPNDFQSNLFRVIQEVITNISKHSGSKQINCEMKTDFNFITIQIHYDGKGIKDDEVVDLSKKGLGLKSIQARLNLIGGRIQYENFQEMNKSTIIIPQTL